MRNSFLFFLFFIAFFVLAVFSGNAVLAQGNPFDIDIEFPISELGNCESLEACESYCDEPDHIDACIAWAEDNGIDVPEHEDDAVENGPGGCASEAECHAYCENPVNVEECVNFAVESGHMTAEEAERALAGGPGGCRSRAECDAFCGTPGNELECIEFAVREGHMTADEAKRIKAFLAGELSGDFGRSGVGGFEPEISGDHPDINVGKAKRILEELGGGPGGCATFEECNVFCTTPENSEQCFSFALEHGLIESDEAERIQRLMEAEGPGGCRGAECRDFCNQPGNELECLAFAEEHGLVGAEEVSQARRFLEATAEGGPGGCRGRECEAYCNDHDNRDECFAFAKSSGVLPPEELERIEKLHSLGRKVEEQGGPGDCRSERECMAYCSDPAHFDECAAFAVNEGFLSRDEAEQSLREFIGAERFNGKFPGELPDGFEHEGFAPGEFPPDFENIPPEYREQFEEEFRSRFERFEQFQEEFGGGKVSPPPQPSDFGDRGDFDAREGFGGGSFDFGSSGSTGDDQSHVTLTRNPSGTFTITITDPQGIQEFFFNPKAGSHYRGGLSCDREFKTETTAFGQMTFPLDSYIIDCSGNEFEFVIPARADFDSISPPSAEKVVEKICPALPTVESCPLGFSREVAHESSECGTYYACVPSVPGDVQAHDIPPEGAEGYEQFIPDGIDLENLSPEELEKLKQLQQFAPDGSFKFDDWVYPEEFEGVYPEGIEGDRLYYAVPEGSLMANIVKLFLGLRLVR